MIKEYLKKNQPLFLRIIENEFQQAEWDCALKRKENRIKMKNDF